MVFYSSANQAYRPKGFENKTNASNFEAFLHLLLSLAGCASRAGNPLLADFVLVAQKLEKLGFIYHRNKVMIAEQPASLFSEKIGG